MICIVSKDDLPTWKIQTGYDWFRQADGGVFESLGRPWSHFWFRKWFWKKGVGYHPVLIAFQAHLSTWEARTRPEIWTRHPFESNGKPWFHGAKYPILEIQESWWDRMDYKIHTGINRLYRRFKG